MIIISIITLVTCNELIIMKGVRRQRYTGCMTMRTMKMGRVIFFRAAWCETLSSPALSWLAKPQAEERRDWEADSASKPAPAASDSHSWASEPKNLETPLF